MQTSKEPFMFKQASRQWNKRFDEEIKRFGFIQNRDEPCVYRKASGSDVVFLILYVDDILIMGNNIPKLKEVKDYLGKCFSVKDLGEAAYILGIKIYRDRSLRLIGLNQSAYIDKILKNYNMAKLLRKVLYRWKGSIMNAVKEHKPELAFAQNLAVDCKEQEAALHFWRCHATQSEYKAAQKLNGSRWGGRREVEMEMWLRMAFTENCLDESMINSHESCSSERMDRFLDQVDAIELYCEKKLKSHSDNLVGIFAMGATGFGSVVEPTQSLSKIMHGVLSFTLVGAHTALRHALGLAQFRCFDLKKEHKYKNLLMRIVVFAGGPIYKYRSYSSDLGAMLSQAGIGLDVVNYRTQQGEKTRILNDIVEFTEEDIRCRILNLPHHLYKFEILPLVVEGEKTR
ncbi:retrotransposon protein, putative, ty1-copia subclass [Tanacetum coccineum]